MLTCPIRQTDIDNSTPFISIVFAYKFSNPISTYKWILVFNHKLVKQDFYIDFLFSLFFPGIVNHSKTFLFNNFFLILFLLYLFSFLWWKLWGFLLFFLNFLYCFLLFLLWALTKQISNSYYCCIFLFSNIVSRTFSFITALFSFFYFYLLNFLLLLLLIFFPNKYCWQIWWNRSPASPILIWCCPFSKTDYNTPWTS